MGFTCTRGAEKQDIRLSAVHIFLIARFARTDALVVVVDGHGKRTLRTVLADYPGVKEVIDFPRLRQRQRRRLACRLGVLGDDFITKVDALVADVDTGSTNELTDLFLALSTERALQGLCSVG